MGMHEWMNEAYCLLLGRGRSVAPGGEDVAHDGRGRLLGEDLETLKTAVAERVLGQHSRNGAADDLV